MRWLLLVSLLVLTLVRVPPAAGPLNNTDASIHRSEGAKLRGRVDRAARLIDEGHRRDGLETIGQLLHHLRVLRDSDSGATSLDVETIDTIARELLTLRNDALLEAWPFPANFRGEFLSSVLGAATWGDWALDVPTSITLVQAVLESNWGRNAPGNALFGMKGTGTAGSLQRRVVEYRGSQRSRPVHSFRSYHNIGESIADHARLLSQSRRYAHARAVAEDPDAYARALQGVYASDPRYAQKLSAMTRSLDLLRFDVPGAAPYRPIEHVAPRDKPAPAG